METSFNEKLAGVIKTMLSLIMLAIVVSFIPGFGVRAEDREVKVSINADGLLPAVGNKIRHTGFTLTSQDGGEAHCKIVDPIPGFTNGVQWQDGDKKIMDEGDIFEAEQYLLYFSVNPDPGYKVDTTKKNNFKLKRRNYYITASNVEYVDYFDCYVVSFEGSPCLYAQSGWSELNLKVDAPVAGKQIYNTFSYTSTIPSQIYSEKELNKRAFKDYAWAESEDGVEWHGVGTDESFKKGYYYNFIGVNTNHFLEDLEEDFYTFGDTSGPHAISQNFKVSLNEVDNLGFDTNSWSNKGYIQFGRCREEVDTIEVDITMPVANASPKWDGTVKSDKYSLVKNNNEFVRWYDDTAEEYLRSGDKFVANHQYYAEFEVMPGDLYRWAPTTNLEVNGIKADAVSNSIKEESKKTSSIKFRVPFNCTAMSDMYISGMRKYPVIGNTIGSTDANELIIEDPILDIKKVYGWKIKNKAGEYKNIDDSEQFRQGVKYYLPIKVSYDTDSSIIFPTIVQSRDFEIIVEGADKAFIEESNDPYKEVIIYAEFTPLKPGTSIDIMGYKRPSVGETITYTDIKARISSHYVIDETYNTEQFKNGIAWGEVVDDNEVLFSKNYTNEFYEGHEYILKLLVKPAEGYGIPSSIEDIKAKLEGYDAEVRECTIPGCYFVVIKKKATVKISRIDFQLNEPVVGQPMSDIDISTVPENAFKDKHFYKEMGYSFWRVSDTNDEESFKDVEAGAVFEAGKYYMTYPAALLFIAAVKESGKPGSVLDDTVASGFSGDIKLYVNGEAFDVNKYVLYGPLTGDINNAEISGIVDKEYEGKAVTQTVKVTFAGKELSEGTDYKIAYKDNNKVGTATVTVTGLGNYEGNKSVTFKITKKPEEVKPEPTATPEPSADPVVTSVPTAVPATPAPTAVPTTAAATPTPAAKEIKPGEKVDGIGTLSEDGKTLTDESGKKYIVSEKATGNDIKKNENVADITTGGKYKITAVNTKAGKASGGTVEYIAPYNSGADTVTVPDTITINNVTFNVTTISSDFSKNNKDITKVVIGKNVTKIAANAFKGCTKLKTVIIKTKKLRKVGKGAFKTIKKGATFKCPKKKLKAYKKLLKKSGLPKKAKFKKS